MTNNKNQTEFNKKKYLDTKDVPSKLQEYGLYQSKNIIGQNYSGQIAKSVEF